MPETENQMGLFETGGPLPDTLIQDAKPAPTPAPNAKAPAIKSAPQQKPARPAKSATQTAVRQTKAAPRHLSGLVPQGDVRLTANIRQDLHLKLKIAAARRRTTIGEMIEELIDQYV